MATLKATDLVGAVSMLYAILLHEDSMSPGTMSSMTVLHSDVVNVIIATLQFFNRVCELNLEFFQVRNIEPITTRQYKVMDTWCQERLSILLEMNTSVELSRVFTSMFLEFINFWLGCFALWSIASLAGIGFANIGFPWFLASCLCIRKKLLEKLLWALLTNSNYYYFSKLLF